MKLYRLYTSCEGEYSCDNYLGLFKSIDPMLSCVKNHLKDVKYVSVSLNEKEEIFVDGVDSWYNDYMYEIIDTDNLI
jgi:hypothetical protein